jgi:hypothetical protein
MVPEYRMDVNGVVRASSYFVSAVNTTVSGAGPYDWTYLGAADGSAARAAAVQIGDIAGAKYALLGGSYDLSFSKHVSTGSWALGMRIQGTDATDASPNVYIVNNLGVGAASPSYRLEVAGELGVSYTNAISTMQGGTGYSIFRMYAGNGSSVSVVEFQIRNRSDAGDFSTIGNYSNHDVRIRTNNTDKVTVQAGGNVGIGTVSPGYKLEVAGTLYASGTATFASIIGSSLDISGASLQGTVKHTQGNYRIYRNLTRFDNYGNGTGAIAVYTTIPWSAANMLTIQIKGYQYGGGGPFDITFGVYAGEGNFFNPGYFANNDYFLGEYYWARDSNNYVVLILGSTSGSYGAQVWVSEYKQGFSNLNTTYADGWSMAKITSTSGLSTVTAIPNRKVVTATTLSASGSASIGGTLTMSNVIYMPGSSQVVFNNETSTWSYIGRTNTPSTTFLGSQLKNIIACGGGAAEGLAVGPNGVPGVTNYSAFEINNNGAGYFRQSLSVGTTATTFTGEFATSLRVGGGTYASTSTRFHLAASTQYGQIIEHNPGAGSEGDAYDTLFLVQTYDSATAKATIGFRCNSAVQHNRPIIQAYRDTSGGSGASGRMDIKMRDNSGGYSAAIGIRSSLASAFYGAITSTGDITAYSSDARLKENVVKIENAINKVSQINGVYFSWKPEAEKLGLKIARPDEVGVLAQEIQKVLPEAVYLAPFDQSDEDPLVSKSGEHYLTVKYEKIVPLLIEAIKEQQATIAALEQRINSLEESK